MAWPHLLDQISDMQVLSDKVALHKLWSGAGFEREESVKAHGYRRGIFDSACHAGTEA